MEKAIHRQCLLLLCDGLMELYLTQSTRPFVSYTPPIILNLQSIDGIIYIASSPAFCFCFNSALHGKAMAVIHTAMNEIAQKSCIKFVLRTGFNWHLYPNFVHFFPGQG